MCASSRFFSTDPLRSEFVRHVSLDSSLELSHVERFDHQPIQVARCGGLDAEVLAVLLEHRAEREAAQTTDQADEATRAVLALVAV